jgi:hypothetical protein
MAKRKNGEFKGNWVDYCEYFSRLATGLVCPLLIGYFAVQVLIFLNISNWH